MCSCMQRERERERTGQTGLTGRHITNNNTIHLYSNLEVRTFMAVKKYNCSLHMFSGLKQCEHMYIEKTKPVEYQFQQNVKY